MTNTRGKQLRSYLDELLTRGLIEAEEISTHVTRPNDPSKLPYIYHTTESGETFLSLYEQTDSYFNSINIDVRRRRRLPREKKWVEPKWIFASLENDAESTSGNDTIARPIGTESTAYGNA